MGTQDTLFFSKLFVFVECLIANNSYKDDLNCENTLLSDPICLTLKDYRDITSNYNTTAPQLGTDIGANHFPSGQETSIFPDTPTLSRDLTTNSLHCAMLSWHTQKEVVSIISRRRSTSKVMMKST